MKRIMKGRTTISREGRFLLASIFVLVAGTFIGIGFIAHAQEAQGEMLNQAMKASEQLQTSVDAIQDALPHDELLGTFETTFYCAGFGKDACPICGTNGITSTGTICSPLGNALVTVAVDPRVIPYGTRLKIVMGDQIIYGIAEDTGGFARGEFPVSRIDVCTSNHEEAIILGTRELEVYVMEGGQQ